MFGHKKDESQTKACLDALSRVQDPDLHKDIVTLGFIKNLEIKGGDVSFTLELTTPACPVKEDLKRQCSEYLLEIDWVKNVEVTLGAKPRSIGPSEEGKKNIQNIRHIIGVSSCKGGVGKSTISTNLAISIANSGASVGLLDADIYGPSQPTMFGVADTQPYVEDQNFIPLEVCGVKMMSAGYLFPPGEAAVLRGPMVSNVLQQLLFMTKWGELDYLILDMPPGTGDTQLTISQVLNISGAMIVSTPQKISLLDVGKGIAMFDKVSVPVLGIVENMSYFDCGNCDTRHELYGPSGVGRLADQFGIDVLGKIPFVPEVVKLSDRGQPPAADPTTPVAEAYKKLADEVIRQVAISTHGGDSLPQINIEWAS